MMRRHCILIVMDMTCSVEFLASRWFNDAMIRSFFIENPWRHQVVWTKIKFKINNWIRWRPTMYCSYKQTVNEEVKNMFAQIAVIQYGRYIIAN